MGGGERERGENVGLKLNELKPNHRLLLVQKLAVGVASSCRSRTINCVFAVANYK